MWLTLDDLRCSECGAFAHPLFDTCPSCDAPHRSWREEAAAGSIGAVRLMEAPETQSMARDLTLRYTIRVNAVGDSTGQATLLDAVTHLADALAYRMAGDAIPITDDARLTLHDGSLIARVRPSKELLAEIALPAVVGAAAGHGEVTLHYAPGTSLADPGAPSGVAGAPDGQPATAGALRLTIANRRGLFAEKARDEHFEAFARWLGVLAAAAAERRWTEIGLPAYLVELGLAPRELGLTPAKAAAPSKGDTPSTIETSLAELERLHAARLVSDDEYAAKRREILARL